MSPNDEVLKFVHPSNIVIAGPTGSGKTRFVLDCLKHCMFEVAPTELNTEDLDRTYPDRLIWVYGEWQPLYKEVQKLYPNVEFVKEINFELNPDQRNLVILDDFMIRAANDKNVAQLFIQGSHHRNATIIYIVQNLFIQGSQARNIQLNTQYFVLMKTNRDFEQITRLGSQLFEKEDRTGFVDAFRDATRKPHSYLLVDMHQKTESAWKLRSGIFPGDKHVVYILNSMSRELEMEKTSIKTKTHKH